MRQRTPHARKRTTPVTRGLAVAVLLALAFVAVTWFAAGPLKSAQLDQQLNRVYPIEGFRGVLVALDRIGQRAVCLPILTAVVTWVAVRHRSARPVLVALIGVLTINIVVWILKIWLGRGAPVARQPAFFVDNQMYPSGHAANVVMVYGLCVYLIVHYAVVTQRTRHILYAVVGVLMVIMTMTSVLLRWHWFTDLVGGYLVAGALLAGIVAVDAAVPFTSRRLAVLPADALPEVPVNEAAGRIGSGRAPGLTTPGADAQPETSG